MPFLPVVDLWIASEPPLEQSLPQAGSKGALEQSIPRNDKDSAVEQSFPLDMSIEIEPFEIEGSVESFDPLIRAIELAKTLPRNWCGIYSSYENGSKFEVTLKLSKIIPVGQIVSLSGEMRVGQLKTNVYGTLNAKSDQFELLPLANKLIAGLEPGGSFIGLQGLTIAGWNSSDLNNSGGKLLLKSECDQEVSKSPAIISIW